MWLSIQIERDSMTTNGFFSVGQKTFIKACDMGMNPACALLAMACGTGKDNATTKWSAEAVANHIGVRWTTAKEAVTSLIDHHLVTPKTENRTRPTYKIEKEGDSIWLPKALIEGAANEVAPVNRLRQTQDVMTLRLLVELYSAQNLREDGGISTKVMYQEYDRQRAGERGIHVVWDFAYKQEYVSWCGVTKPHRRDKLTADEIAAEKNPGVDFFKRKSLLVSMGLLEWVPYVFDGPKGEPIHAMHSYGLQIERDLFEAANGAGCRMVADSYKHRRHGFLVPVPAHVEQVQVIGIARLRYRPQTKLTSAWWADHHTTCQNFIDGYDSMAVKKVAFDDRFAGFA